MNKSDILRQMIEQAQHSPAPNITLYLYVRPLGGGQYHVEELAPVSLPHVRFSFLTDNGDEIIIWSVNSFMRREAAHEIALLVGASYGLYV